MRKTALALAAVMSLFTTLSACASKKQNNTMEQDASKKVLVAYFSATGTTRTVAKMIATATKGELYQIKPKAEYSSADLDWTDKTSRCCRENADPKSRPAIVKDKANLNAYDTIYLGFPNWWNGAPRIINTFIETYGLKGKTVYLFMTSGGSGIENSEKTLKKLYPGVNWKKGRLLNGSTQEDVNEWVKSNK